MVIKGAHHSVRTNFTIAALLFVLGAGNTWFGSYKANEYSRLLAQARQEKKTERGYLSQLPGGVRVIFDYNKEREQLRRIKARLDYYKLVERGGTGFLLASLIYVLWTVGQRGKQATESPTD